MSNLVLHFQSLDLTNIFLSTIKKRIKTLKKIKNVIFQLIIGHSTYILNSSNNNFGVPNKSWYNTILQ